MHCPLIALKGHLVAFAPVKNVLCMNIQDDRVFFTTFQASNAAQRAALQTARLEGEEAAEQPADTGFAAAAERAAAEQVAMAEAQVS